MSEVMMLNIPIVYASHDGHTRVIAEHLAQTLTDLGATPTITDLAKASPEQETIENAAIVVVAAAIRYGHPLKPAEAFLKTNRSLLDKKPVVLLSINLTARKPGKDTAEGSVYVRKWIKRHNFTPALAAAIAGKLDYKRYGPFDKFMIRLIMKITGGPTHPDACVEFTDWAQVDRIAGEIIEIAKEKAA